MTLFINNKNAKDLEKILSEKLNKAPQKGNIAKHFGKLKRGLDGLKYQNDIRKNKD